MKDPPVSNVRNINDGFQSAFVKVLFSQQDVTEERKNLVTEFQE